MTQLEAVVDGKLRPTAMLLRYRRQNLCVCNNEAPRVTWPLNKSAVCREMIFLSLSNAAMNFYRQKSKTYRHLISSKCLHKLILNSTISAVTLLNRYFKR